MMKQCKACGRSRGAGDFARRSSAADGLQSRCRECMYKAGRKWGRSSQYGLADSVGLELRFRCCDICGAPPRVSGGAHAIDHCHATGAVRGVLCRACNQGIGLFADSSERLIRAAWYVNRGADYRAVDREEGQA